MSKSGLITPCGPVEDPVSHIRVALLTVAMAFAAVLCAELLTVARTTHAIKIDLWDPPYQPEPIVRRPVHVLTISADRGMTFGGVPVADLRHLRVLIDVDQQYDPVPTLRVEPDPRLRYADFIEVLAVIERAAVYQYCVDFDPERRLTSEFKCTPRPYRAD